MRPGRVLMILATTLAAAGAVRAEVPATSASHGYATYREGTDDLTLLVDTYPATLHRDDAFIPVPIAVGRVTKGKPVRVTPASFELEDSAGHRYAPASLQQVRESYSKQPFDRTVLHARPIIVGLAFESAERVPSSFFPPVGGLVRDSVSLPGFTWFADVLYFPRPATLDGVLTLTLRAEGAAAPVAARVALPKS